MNSHLNAVKITDRVYWVGAIDWAVRDFHGYSTERGTTYNAYLVMSDKITLIDTVKAPFRDEMMARISSVTDPGNIRYIISNHSEMDHTGALPEVIKEIKPEKVFASPMGVKALNAHFNLDREIIPVKSGDEINLGNMNISFCETKMLHWPDSMFSYLKEEKVLFSQDAFGMHLANSRRFEDEIDESVIRWEAEKYFANILMPFSSQILKLLEALPGLNLKIEKIAPDHGPVWRVKPERIIELYRKWSLQELNPKAIIVFDTMWQSTAIMAKSIADGIADSGIEVKVMPLSARNRSHVAAELLESSAILVGSPTLNNNIFPTVADVLTYLKGLKPRNKIGAAFGSYGWSGESVPQIAEYLKAMNVETFFEGLSVKYVPKQEDLQKCFELGKQVGMVLNQKIAEAK